MKRLIICLFITALFSNAYSQVTSDSLLINGHYRSFHFYKPQGNTKNYHLIFLLHGTGWNGKMMMKFTQSLEAISTTEHLFVVYPDAYNKSWNNCRKPEVEGEDNPGEEAFFNSMIHYFKKRYKVENKSAFAIGISAGGLMAYKLAMTMPGKFKAISAVVANLPDTIYCNQSLKPVAVMITNGTDDPINPYNGGKVVMNGRVLGFVKSTNNTFKYWANVAGYKGQPAEERLLPKDSTKQTIDRYTFREPGKPEVTLLKVNGMGHDNPKGINIFLASWEFFKRELQR